MTWGALVRAHQKQGTAERCRDSKNCLVYTLTTGEKTTVPQLVPDPRNIHGITESGLRGRIDRGLRDPVEIFAPRDRRHRPSKTRKE